MQYYYRIRHKQTGVVYVGCQYGKKADPSLLLIKYFTSSKRVKQIILEEGKESFEIIKIIISKDARQFESRVLQYCYRRLGRDVFVERFLNRNIAPGILNDETSLQKANTKGKRQKLVDAANKRVANGTHNFITSPRVPTKEDIENLIKRSLGNKWNVGRILTQEQKHNASEKSKGNINVRGKAWWNDGKNMKRSKECPGEGWIRGALKHSDDTKRKRSESNRGKILSDETKKKISNSKRKIKNEFN